MVFRHLQRLFGVNSWSCSLCVLEPVSPSTTPAVRRVMARSSGYTSPSARDSMEEELCPPGSVPEEIIQPSRTEEPWWQSAESIRGQKSPCDRLASSVTKRGPSLLWRSGTHMSDSSNSSSGEVSYFSDYQVRRGKRRRVPPPLIIA
eukprot:TRINITY_DN46237_c0_g1_i1.p1 TRINITY_DN46237_c0_g1~~TRINITY_DN46237_c0_g1_i1.p1  ORF type:complete len:170 (+),score=21.26 TRINITY_DN46237_c0_g1_i1:72-512(+)